MRRYYSSRKQRNKLDLEQLYTQLQNLYLYFRNKNYFKEKLDITQSDFPDEVKYKVALLLKANLIPPFSWSESKITEDNIFDTIEFLYDHISKPGELIDMETDSGWRYQDYDGYDEVKGQEEFIEMANMLLYDYRDGYELLKNGEIYSIGDKTLEDILNASVITYDIANVDSKVKSAVYKWKNRHLDLEERRKAIQDMADVFEWLKKTGHLEEVLANKDDKMLFEVANNFAIRHHNPNQKSNYDKAIWYSWMFHFYLATYHAVIRLIDKKNKYI